MGGVFLAVELPRNFRTLCQASQMVEIHVAIVSAKPLTLEDFMIILRPRLAALLTLEQKDVRL